MSYRRKGKGDDWADAFAGLCMFGGILFGIFSVFGPWGLVTAPAAVALIWWACSQWSKASQARNHEAYLKSPCKHGTVGGQAKPESCPTCVREKLDREREAAEKLARERAAAEKARQEHQTAWLAKVRMPEYLRAMNPREFEILCLKLFSQMGYDVEETPYVGDSGSDGFLYKDGRKYVLQCKRVQGSVGEPILRDLFGTMHHNGCQSAIVVTTGRVSTQARVWSKGKNIHIVEMEELLKLINSYFREGEVIPTDFQATGTQFFGPCPQCGNELRRITGRRGSFIGCRCYPACKYTRATSMPPPPRAGV